VCYTLCVATPYILCPSVYFEVSPPLQKILDPPLIEMTWSYPQPKPFGATLSFLIINMGYSLATVLRTTTLSTVLTIQGTR